MAKIDWAKIHVTVYTIYQIIKMSHNYYETLIQCNVNFRKIVETCLIKDDRKQNTHFANSQQ